MSLQAAAREEEPYVMLSAEGTNFFNQVPVGNLMKQVYATKEWAPAWPLLRMTLLKSTRPLVLRSLHTGQTITINAQTGVPQGDARSSLLAAFALTSRLAALERISPQVTTIAYIDDIYVIAPARLMARVLDTLQQDLRDGYHLNHGKTTLAVIQRENGDSFPPEIGHLQVENLKTDAVKVLGTPVSFSEKAIQEAIKPCTKKICTILKALAQPQVPPQVALLIARNIPMPRLMHLMRSVDSHFLLPSLTKVDEATRELIATLAGIPRNAMSAQTLQIITLSVAHGGLGLPPLATMAPSARIARLLEIAPTLLRRFPDGVPPMLTSQLAARWLDRYRRDLPHALKDPLLKPQQTALLLRTVDLPQSYLRGDRTGKLSMDFSHAESCGTRHQLISRGNEYVRARIHSQTGPVAGAFLRSTLLLPPHVARQAIADRIQVNPASVINMNNRCPLCNVKDPGPAHFLDCSTSRPFWTIMHNQLVAVLTVQARQCGYSVSSEVPLPNEQGKEDLRVDFIVHDDIGSTAYVLTIVQAMSKRHIRRAAQSAAKALQHRVDEKDNKYADATQQHLEMPFRPIVLTHGGAVHKHLSTLINKLAHRLVSLSNEGPQAQWSTAVALIRQKFSWALQRWIGVLRHRWMVAARAEQLDKGKHLLPQDSDPGVMLSTDTGVTAAVHVPGFVGMTGMVGV